MSVPGSFKFPIRGRTNVKGVLQSDSRRQRRRTILEEIDLQDHIPIGRSGAGVLQIAKFLGAIGVTGSWFQAGGTGEPLVPAHGG